MKDNCWYKPTRYHTQYSWLIQTFGKSKVLRPGAVVMVVNSSVHEGACLNADS